MTDKLQNFSLPGYSEKPDGWIIYAGFIVYLVCVALLVTALPSDIFGADLRIPIVTIGIIAIWRYTWAMVHLLRSMVYRAYTFPRLRKKAESLHNPNPAWLGVISLSFKLAPDELARSYRALFRALSYRPYPVHVVASVTDLADIELTREIFAETAGMESVTLHLIQQDGSGKRPAIAEALRCLHREVTDPALRFEDGCVALMDGDSLLPDDIFDNTLPFFVTHPRIGGLTTDNRSIVKGTALAKEWYYVRMAQRHMYMCSLALSRKLLVLTGRFSVFRASIVLDPEFMHQMEYDSIKHWRLGTIRLLTGDDKTSWYFVLKQGWEMLYVPDTCIMTQETLPSNNFMYGTLQLMIRYFGNMLRSNWRAVRLGPRRTGAFLWWCLIDQRISYWTTLSGPFLSLLVAVFVSPYFLLVYFLWVMISRLFHTTLIYLHRGRFSPLFIPVIFYNQVVGSWVKLHMHFRMDRQSWTRHRIGVAMKDVFWSAYLNVVAILAFLIFLGFLTGLLQVPSLSAL